MTIDEAFKFRKERENSLREIATKVKIEAIEKELKKIYRSANFDAVSVQNIEQYSLNKIWLKL
jgi:hypothetical protein